MNWRSHKFENIENMDAVLINRLGFKKNRESFERRCRSMFGASYYIAKVVEMKLGEPITPIYLLLALHFLKNYCTNNVMSIIFGLDEKTVRKWTIVYVNKISNMLFC